MLPSIHLESQFCVYHRKVPFFSIQSTEKISHKVGNLKAQKFLCGAELADYADLDNCEISHEMFGDAP